MSGPLREERDLLLRSLRDLEEEYAAGELDEADYNSLHDDYTVRAATVLRQLEFCEGPSVHVTDRPSQNVLGVVETPADRGQVVHGRPYGGRARLRVGAALLAVIAGGIGYAVAEASGERGAGDEATGDLPEGSVDRITKAQALVADGEILEAVKVYDDLLADDPENPVALAQRGWLLSRVDATLVDSGLASIERAIAIDPTYPEAHFFRGMILWRAKDEPALAVESFQKAVDAGPPPDVLASIESVKRQAQADAGSRATATP